MDAGRCPECGALVERPRKRDPRSRRARIRRLITRAAILALAAAGIWYGGRYAVYRWWPTTHLQQMTASNGRWAALAKRVLTWRHAKERTEAEERKRKIEVEVASLGEHDWAGIYRDLYSGNRYLALTPRSGFVELTFYDIGVMLDGYGVVRRVTDGTIELQRQMRWPELHRRDSADDEYLRIRWGRRHCLESREGLDFACSDGFDLIDARIGFLFRASDQRYPLSGWPALPRRYQESLPSWPQTAKIIDVTVMPFQSEFDNVSEYRIRATLDKGLRDGIQIGMILDGLFADLPDAEVTEASPTTSVVEYATGIHEGEDLIAPQIGWQFAIPDDWEHQDAHE
jgi:hypothetical protein